MYCQTKNNNFITTDLSFEAKIGITLVSQTSTVSLGLLARITVFFPVVFQPVFCN